MSKFSDIIGSVGVPVLFDQFGDAGVVSYTPAGGVAVELTAVVGPEKTEEMESDTGGRDVRVTRTLLVRTDPDSDQGGVAQPATNDSVTISSVEWAVESIIFRTDNLARLQLVRLGVVELSRANYRR